MGNEVSFKMAERLLRAGAKVDAKNKFGETPLMLSTTTTNYDAVELLLKHGADAYMMDNDGRFLINTVNCNHKMGKIINESHENKIKELKRHPDHESQSKCSVCGKKSKRNQKCTGCYLTWYCGQKCQKDDWIKHKSECQKTKSQYKIGTYKPEYVSTFAGISRPGTSDPPNKNKNLVKSHFVVKVQVAFDMIGGRVIPEGALAIYNKDKSFIINLQKKDNEELHSQLVLKITAEGFGGLKGYFHVILEPGDKAKNQFRINPENIFVEPW